MVTTNLIGRARAGDEEAFRQLVEPYRRELQVHCYRFLGSAQDAEDVLQETLLSAWRGLGGFEERASVRTWLYRVATSRCLNALRSRSRRPSPGGPPPWTDAPESNGTGEVVWLEPYPDVLLDDVSGPEARYEAREAISLAFVTALQLLPPRQRAVLILRDVLGFRARETAEMLDASEESVTSALRRARAALSPAPPPPPPPGSPAERRLVDRLARAFENGDVDGLIALLTDDVRVAMPPAPLEYVGPEVAGRFLRAAVFPGGRTFRLVATRANGQPAFGLYMRDANARVAHASGLLVVTLAGAGVAGLTRFESGTLPRFGLPRTLPD